MSVEHSEKQRLWIITECVCAEIDSIKQHLTDTTEGLAGEFDVKVICGRADHSPPALCREARNRTDIFRVWSTGFDRRFAVNRFVNELTFCVSIFWRTLRNFRRGDRVLVVTAPLYLPFTAAIASLIKGGFYTLLIDHFYPDRLVALGKLRRSSIAAKTIRWANSWLFKHAARIIVFDSDMAELVSARIGGLNIPVKVIPARADPGELAKIGEPTVPTSIKHQQDDALKIYRDAFR